MIIDVLQRSLDVANAIYSKFFRKSLRNDEFKIIIDDTIEMTINRVEHLKKLFNMVLLLNYVLDKITFRICALVDKGVINDVNTCFNLLNVSKDLLHQTVKVVLLLSTVTSFELFDSVLRDVDVNVCDELTKTLDIVKQNREVVEFAREVLLDSKFTEFEKIIRFDMFEVKSIVVINEFAKLLVELANQLKRFRDVMDNVYQHIKSRFGDTKDILELYVKVPPIINSLIHMGLFIIFIAHTGTRKSDVVREMCSQALGKLYEKVTQLFEEY